MPYYTENQLAELGFKSVGRDVKISDKASIYNHELIEIGDYSRIDDFCVVSGKVEIGRFVHIAPFCLIAGGNKGVFMADFSGLAYNVQIFSQSDDYQGNSLTNPTIPSEYKEEKKAEVSLGKHVIVGAGSIVMPGVKIAEGCAIGAMTLVTKSTLPWGIYVGNPAIRIKERKKKLLECEVSFLGSLKNDSV